jgi:hypothetical protein
MSVWLWCCWNSDNLALLAFGSWDAFAFDTDGIKAWRLFKGKGFI